MKLKINNIIHVGLHIFFWCMIIYFYSNYSFLRPSLPGSAYREYICIAMIISMVYFNYLFLIPQYLQKGRIIIYWIITILSILMVAVIEYLLFKPIIVSCYSHSLDEEQLKKYLNVLFFLYLTRSICFFLFFFIIKLYQDLTSKYTAESQAIADSVQTIAVMQSMKDIKIIKIAEISYLSHIQNYTYFHLISGQKYFQYISLKKVEGLLPEKSYLRINKSNIVMLSQVTDYNNLFVTLDLIENGEQVKLQISPKNKEEILNILKNNKNKNIEISQVKGGTKKKNGGIKPQKSSSLAIEPGRKKTELELNLLENEIYKHILNNPNSKLTKIVEVINKPQRTIERSIKKMKEMGLIEYRGAKKNGGYYVIENENNINFS